MPRLTYSYTYSYTRISYNDAPRARRDYSLYTVNANSKNHPLFFVISVHSSDPRERVVLTLLCARPCGITLFPSGSLSACLLPRCSPAG